MKIADYATCLKVETGAGHEIYVRVSPGDSAEKIGRKVIAVMDGGNGSGDVQKSKPIPMLLYCPECGKRHIDVKDGDVDWTTKEHHTHSCQHCGMTWRPAVVPTVGVQFLPGFKNKGA